MLNVRPIALTGAVIAFFLVSITGICSGVSADTACIRGIAGAVAGYVIASMAAKMFNKIAYEAMTNTTRYNEQVTNAGRNPKPE